MQRKLFNHLFHHGITFHAWFYLERILLNIFLIFKCYAISYSVADLMKTFKYTHLLLVSCTLVLMLGGLVYSLRIRSQQ